MNVETKQFDNLEGASNSAAQYITEQCKKDIQQHGQFSIVLAGGSTPRTLYSLLASTSFVDQIDWSRIHLFWGDERCVSLDDPSSNYAMAHDALLSKVKIPTDNIHPMEASTSSPSDAAKGYENKLRSFFNSPHAVPSFDLVILGMGNDGHTASLFPGNASLNENDRLVIATENINASPQVPRITMTLPLLNQAKNVLFLISGKQKGQILQTIMDHPQKAQIQYPAARIKPKNQLIWFYSKK